MNILLGTPFRKKVFSMEPHLIFRDLQDSINSNSLAIIVMEIWGHLLWFRFKLMYFHNGYSYWVFFFWICGEFYTDYFYSWNFALKSSPSKILTKKWVFIFLKFFVLWRVNLTSDHCNNTTLIFPDPLKYGKVVLFVILCILVLCKNNKIHITVKIQ